MGEAFIFGGGHGGSAEGKGNLHTMIYNGNATFQVPSGIKGNMRVLCVGGGGYCGIAYNSHKSTGSSAGGFITASGGGGGNINIQELYIPEGQNIPINIGDGGSTGSGGTTIFGTFVSATGGERGNSLAGGSGGSGGGGGAGLEVYWSSDSGSSRENNVNGAKGGDGYFGGGGGGGGGARWSYSRYCYGNEGGIGGLYGGGGASGENLYSRSTNHFLIPAISGEYTVHETIQYNSSNYRTWDSQHWVNNYNMITKTWDNQYKWFNLYDLIGGGVYNFEVRWYNTGYGGNGSFNSSISATNGTPLSSETMMDGTELPYMDAKSGATSTNIFGGGGGYGGRGGAGYGGGGGGYGANGGNGGTGKNTPDGGWEVWNYAIGGAGGGGGGYGDDGHDAYYYNNNAEFGGGGGGYGPAGYGRGGTCFVQNINGNNNCGSKGLCIIQFYI